MEGTEFVIDSARAKEVSYDPYLKVGTLTTSWISKAGGGIRSFDDLEGFKVFVLRVDLSNKLY